MREVPGYFFFFKFSCVLNQLFLILRDIGSLQSSLLKEILPFSQKSDTISDVLLGGFEMKCNCVPTHQVPRKSDLVSGMVNLGVCSKLCF